MPLDLSRRELLVGAAATLFCAPAIVRATSLMAIRPLPIPLECDVVRCPGHETWQAVEHEKWSQAGQAIRLVYKVYVHGDMQSKEELVKFIQTHPGASLVGIGGWEDAS